MRVIRDYLKKIIRLIYNAYIKKIIKRFTLVDRSFPLTLLPFKELIRYTSKVSKA